MWKVRATRSRSVGPLTTNRAAAGAALDGGGGACVVAGVPRVVLEPVAASGPSSLPPPQALASAPTARVAAARKVRRPIGLGEDAGDDMPG